MFFFVVFVFDFVNRDTLTQVTDLLVESEKPDLLFVSRSIQNARNNSIQLPHAHKRAASSNAFEYQNR